MLLIIKECGKRRYAVGFASCSLLRQASKMLALLNQVYREQWEML